MVPVDASCFSNSSNTFTRAKFKGQKLGSSSGVVVYMSITWCIYIYPIGSMYAIYGNIYHQDTPFMLAYIYIYHTWILWVWMYMMVYGEWGCNLHLSSFLRIWVKMLPKTTACTFNTQHSWSICSGFPALEVSMWAVFKTGNICQTLQKSNTLW